MTWVNGKGVTFGLAALAKVMRGDFADRSKMGHYNAKVLHTNQLASDAHRA